MYTLSVYIAGEIDLLENLDTVHITLLVVRVESAMVGFEDANSHQQPEVNYLPRFGPQLISLEE